ncbi:MAG: SAM-dependent methyltransferase [Frankiales bacterium]|nr:SAM-dependent methyltransferase [Frankiales bacterium]
MKSRMTRSVTDELYGQLIFSQASAGERHRLAALADVFDPVTIEQLSRLNIARSARCLEIGPGLGTLSRWMLDEGGAVSVTVLDRDTRLLTDLQGVEVIQADIRQYEFGAAQYDLIVARNVLVHLRDREAVIDVLVKHLAPGGWLLIGDLADFVTVDTPHTFWRASTAALWQVLRDRIGTEVQWAREFPTPLLNRGFEQVDVDINLPALRGGSALARFWQLTYGQLLEDLPHTGLVRREQVLEALAALRDPDFWDLSLGLLTMWGRKPDPQDGIRRYRGTTGRKVLQGSWRVHAPDAPFPWHVCAFHPGGVAMQANPQVADSEFIDSVSLGHWQETRDGHFLVYLNEIQCARADGRYVGSVEISMDIEVEQSRFSGTATTTYRDANGDSRTGGVTALTGFKVGTEW